MRFLILRVHACSGLRRWLQLVTAFALIVAARLNAAEFRLVPEDVLVTKDRPESTPRLKLNLLVRRAPGETAAVQPPPPALRLRVKSGEKTETVVFRLRVAASPVSAADPLYKEYAYEGELPASAAGMTLIEVVEGNFPAEVRTMVAVSVKAGAEIARVAEPTAPWREHRSAEVPAPVARDAFGAPGLKRNEPVFFVIGGLRGGLHRLDARFQLSFKYQFSSVDHDLGDLGVAVTTTSLWDLHSYSLPFRDSTYRPAVLWMKDEAHLAGTDWSWSLDLGIFEHESNGRGPDPDFPQSTANNDDLSRSMNRSYVRPTFTWHSPGYGAFSVSPKLFVPFLVSDTNTDVAKYRGYADLLLKWTSPGVRQPGAGNRELGPKGHVVSLLWREGTQGGRHFVEADYGMPLRLLGKVPALDRIFSDDTNGWLLFQWLYGYGETLRDYRTRNPGTLRVGLMIVP